MPAHQFDFKDGNCRYVPIFKVEINKFYQKYGGLWSFKGFAKLIVSTEKAVLLSVPVSRNVDKDGFCQNPVWVPRSHLIVIQYAGRIDIMSYKIDWNTRVKNECSQDKLCRIGQEAWKTYKSSGNKLAFEIYNTASLLYSKPQTIIPFM